MSSAGFILRFSQPTARASLAKAGRPARGCLASLSSSSTAAHRRSKCHSDTSPIRANNMATVMLNDHWDKKTASPRRSLRNVSQCATPAINVATIPSTTRAVPNMIALSCKWTISGVGDLSRRVRKNATIAKPNVAMVNAVRTQASVVRSSESCVRNFAMLVRSSCGATPFGLAGSSFTAYCCPAPQTPEALALS
jgi:hypothetical protein